MPVRLSNVLRTVAKKAGYGKKLPKGHGLGLAVHRSFHSYVATAVHVVVHDDGTFSIPQVDTAIDCGRYVNPEGIRKQIEGAAIYGNTVARWGKITTKRGAVEQSNFHDYPITRMSDAPLDVRVHIVEDFVHLRPCLVSPACRHTLRHWSTRSIKPPASASMSCRSVKRSKSDQEPVASHKRVVGLVPSTRFFM
jgi:hypothetical protein